MKLTANNPNRKSWLPVAGESDFPIQNIPFGVFLTKDDFITVGTRIGDYAIDLSSLQQLGYLNHIELTDDVFLQDSLNDFISYGKKTWRGVRNSVADIFDIENPTLKEAHAHKEKVIYHIDDVEMQLPVRPGDCTDFYSSKQHAVNVGSMFRDPDNALLPNWLHIPVAYHGRSSSVVVSETAVRRPLGQQMPEGAVRPVFGASKLLDFELEMAFITTDANRLGEAIPVDRAEEAIFGLVIFNDWSARDIQKWEYVPLGPFLSKNFASSVSPWIVTLDALEPFRTAGPKQEPVPLDYLRFEGDKNFDIHLEVSITPENSKPTTVCRSNFKYMYWNMAQQLAHHTVNGCPVNSGDLMASGTISGPDSGSFGSMLELTWKGQRPLLMKDGSQRKFINDGDTVRMKAFCEKNKLRIGFGEVSTKILPARDLKNN